MTPVPVLSPNVTPPSRPQEKLEFVLDCAGGWDPDLFQGLQALVCWCPGERHGAPHGASTCGTGPAPTGWGQHPWDRDSTHGMGTAAAAQGCNIWERTRAHRTGPAPAGRDQHPQGRARTHISPTEPAGAGCGDTAGHSSGGSGTLPRCVRAVQGLCPVFCHHTEPAAGGSGAQPSPQPTPNAEAAAVPQACNTLRCGREGTGPGQPRSGGNAAVPTAGTWCREGSGTPAMWVDGGCWRGACPEQPQGQDTGEMGRPPKNPAVSPGGTGRAPSSLQGTGFSRPHANTVPVQGWHQQTLTSGTRCRAGAVPTG